MCCICSQTDPSNSQLLNEPLVDLVRIDSRKLILALLGMPRQHGFELHRLPRDKFISTQTRELAVATSPPAGAICLLRQAGNHMPVFRVNDELDVFVAELFEWVSHLDQSAKLTISTKSRNSHS